MMISIPQRFLLRFGVCGAAWTIFALAGCGSGSKATVTGTVTYEGKPLPTGTVAFYGKDKQVVTAAIESNGHYSCPRVPVGPVKITVSTPPAAPQGAPSGMPTLETVSIPANYNDPEQSGLTYTVTHGTQEYNIPLK